jgi:DNA-binding response OmpR family regulator
VLVVDDEPMVVDALREVLADAGYVTLGATSFEDGRRLLLAPPVPDVVVADVRLGKYNGLQLAVLRPQATAAIVISGHRMKSSRPRPGSTAPCTFRNRWRALRWWRR